MTPFQLAELVILRFGLVSSNLDYIIKINSKILLTQL